MASVTPDGSGDSNQAESTVSNIQVDPLLVVAYVIFVCGALLLFAAVLRLGYWCINRRARRRHLRWALKSKKNTAIVHDYIGRAMKARHNDYSASDNDSLKIKMEDLFGKPVETTEKQDKYAVVRQKKKEAPKVSILGSTSENGPQHRPEDFWSIPASEVHEEEGSITKVAASSLRINRPAVLHELAIEMGEVTDEDGARKSAGDLSLVAEEAEGPESRRASRVSAASGTESKRISHMSAETSDDRRASRVSAVSGEIDTDGDTASAMAAMVYISGSDGEDGAIDIKDEEPEKSSDSGADISVKPGEEISDLSVNKTQYISEGKRFMTLDDIRAESITAGSFVSLQASWKMREAQIQSGLNAPMLSPTVGLNQIDDDYGPQSKAHLSSVSEDVAAQQQNDHADTEERMFTFEGSKGKIDGLIRRSSLLASSNSPYSGESEERPDSLTKSTSEANVDAGKSTEMTGAKEVHQIYMENQEIQDVRRSSSPGPTFAFPVAPPEDSGSDDDDDADEEDSNKANNDDNQHANRASANSLSSEPVVNKRDSARNSSREDFVNDSAENVQFVPDDIQSSASTNRNSLVSDIAGTSVVSEGSATSSSTLKNLRFKETVEIVVHSDSDEAEDGDAHDATMASAEGDENSGSEMVQDAGR